MFTYAILDTNVGILQWIGEATEEGEAYDLYAADVNEDSHDLIENSKIFCLTPDEAAQVRAWHDGGAKSAETPDCLLPTY